MDFITDIVKESGITDIIMDYKLDLEREDMKKKYSKCIENITDIVNELDIQYYTENYYTGLIGGMNLIEMKEEDDIPLNHTIELDVYIETDDCSYSTLLIKDENNKYHSYKYVSGVYPTYTGDIGDVIYDTRKN